jgi:hypothetical protein
MIIGIQGTRTFNDYTIFLRAMGTALASMPDEDTEVYIYSAGPSVINSFAMEFTNITERSLKSRGKKIKMIKVPPSWLADNMHKIDYLAMFSKPKEPLSKLVEKAESHNVDVGVYRY